MDPSPVTGSHPVAVWNPSSHLHLLFPEVMSLMKDELYAYRAGFMNPTDPLPAAIRAAFILEKNAAATEQGADVPLIPITSFDELAIITRYPSPASDISGYPLPVRL